jgi:hypothetical protein
VEVLSAENIGCSLDQSIGICCDTLNYHELEQQPFQDWDAHNDQVAEERPDHYVQTRSDDGPS